MKKMKIVFGIATLIVTVLVILNGCNKDDIERIPLTEIPDTVFREYLLKNFDTDRDGFISKEEAKAVKVIDLSDLSYLSEGIKSLTGIANFTSLEKLIINGIYYLELLDLSANSMLEVLDCSWNPQLKTLILPDSKRLKSFSCSGTRLPTIDLSGYEFLEDFTFNQGTSFYDHVIGKLSISNSSVKRIECNHPIQDINISNLSNLESLSIKSTHFVNGIHAVDLTKSTKLKTLTCDYVRCVIDISQCTVLEELKWTHVGNKTVDMSKNTALKDLHLTTDESLDLDLSKNTALKNVSLSIKVFNMLDFSNNTLIENLYVEGNGKVNISTCKNLIDLHLINSNTNAINLQQFNALINVRLNNCNIASVNLSGCQNFEVLSISGSGNDNKLDVDVSACKKLRNLYLSITHLDKLNAAGCTALTGFEYEPDRNFPFRFMTSLNMSNCTSLKSIKCDFNLLTMLDVSGCTALTTLSCRRNHLKELDTQTCLALQSLDCSNSSDLKTLILDKNHQITTLYKDDHTEIVLK